MNRRIYNALLKLHGKLEALLFDESDQYRTVEGKLSKAESRIEALEDEVDELKNYIEYEREDLEWD